MTRSFFILVSCILCLVSFISAQEPRTFIYLEHHHYAYIDYLINSGRNLPQFVLTQPYESGFFTEGPDSSGFFARYWKKFYGNPTGVSGQLQLSDKGKYLNDVFVNSYRASGGINIVYPHITLGNRTAIDREYKYDPKYAGDLSESDNWLYGRVNDAYMNLNFGNFDFFIGRMQRNWGPIGHFSLMQSDHPYSYDHLLFSWHNSWLKLSVIAARLEDLPAYGYYPNRNSPDSLVYYPNARKYLTGHRLDIRITDNLQLGLTEMATYGGPERDFEWAFLNPMTFYYGLQRNDRQLNNGNWSLDVFYKPVRRVSLYGQLLIDDYIVNNEPGQDDRERFEDRLAVSVSARAGDLPLRGLNLDISYTRIWNDTYHSRWTYENYHYRELGLGYPCSSCEEVGVKAAYWGFLPIFLENQFIYGRYGDRSITDINLLQKRSFPVKPVTTNYANIFRLKYYLSTRLDAFVNVYYFKKPEHYLNRLNEDSDLTVSFGLDVLISGSISPE